MCQLWLDHVSHGIIVNIVSPLADSNPANDTVSMTCMYSITDSICRYNFYLEGLHSLCSVLNCRVYVYCSRKMTCTVNALVTTKGPSSSISSSLFYCVSLPACFKGCHSELTNCMLPGLCGFK